MVDNRELWLFSALRVTLVGRFWRLIAPPFYRVEATPPVEGRSVRPFNCDHATHLRCSRFISSVDAAPAMARALSQVVEPGVQVD